MPRVRRDGPLALEARWQRDFGDYVIAALPVGDGSRACVGLGGGRLHFVDAHTGMDLAVVDAHAPGLNALAVSPTGAHVASAGQDGAAKLFEAGGRLVATLPGAGRAWADHVAFSPDGSLLAVAAGRVVRIWRTTGQPLIETEPHESTVAGLAWSPDGKSIATACYGGVRVWPVGEGAKARHLPWKGSLVSVSWSPDGSVIAGGSQDCSVHFWRLASSRDAQMYGYPQKPRALAWGPASSYLATSGDQSICLWNFTGKGPEGTRPTLLKGHAAPCVALARPADRPWLASGAQDGDVVVWDPSLNQKPHRRARLGAEITSLAWVRDVTLFAGDAGGRVAAFAA